VRLPIITYQVVNTLLRGVDANPHHLDGGPLQTSSPTGSENFNMVHGIYNRFGDRRTTGENVESAGTRPYPMCELKSHDLGAPDAEYALGNTRGNMPALG